MAVSDHLVVFCGAYSHHGIDLGDGTVMHRSKTSGKICRIAIDEFNEGRPVSIRTYKESDPPPVVLRRALECEGEVGYCLRSNNCEHFATWCKTGQAQSLQVRSVTRRLIGASAKATVRILSQRSPKFGVRAIGRVATPWLVMADVAQLGTEFVAAKLGADPERAEEVGRGAGLAGSVGIGGLVGGPLGAGVGLGLWALGETVSSAICK